MVEIWYAIFGLRADDLRCAGRTELWRRRAADDRGQNRRRTAADRGRDRTAVVLARGVAGRLRWRVVCSVSALLGDGIFRLLSGAFLVLWSLILRGISLEVGGHVDNPLWQGFWDFVFTVSSILLAVLFGAALGNVARGVPLDGNGEFHMAFFTNFRVRGSYRSARLVYDFDGRLHAGDSCRARGNLSYAQNGRRRA